MRAPTMLFDESGCRLAVATSGELEAAGPWAICTSADELGDVLEAGRDAAAS